MRDGIHSGSPALESGQAHNRTSKKRTSERCSICTNRIWSHPVALMEPEGAPEPRHSWVLCPDCHAALVLEMRRSPIRSPLRLSIAMGIVAAERWPQAYNTVPASTSDRRWITFIAWGFVVAMIIHLALIVMIAYIAR